MRKSRILICIGVALLTLTCAWIVYQSQNSNTLVTKEPPAFDQAQADTQLSFVGSQSCQSCHEEQYDQWQQSDHHKAMLEPNPESVLGDFENAQVTFHGIESRFHKKDNEYWIDTIGENTEQASFRVKYTFGHWPLQQYLLETNAGRLQAFNVAWDSRRKQEGGQNWFHLQPNENISNEHPFFWTKHFQNWNSRCADCHSTNLERGYDVASNAFDTTFSEVNVACEACHGPASSHLSLANNSDLSKTHGFQSKASKVLEWRFEKNSDIAKPVGEKNNDDVNMCGQCHSLRSPLVANEMSATNTNADFHDINRLQLLNERTYFADGQIKEEAFVLGSFLQSKMHHKGVTCSNCHNPHTGKTLVEGNSLCVQCHKPAKFDTPEHHNHPASSEGGQCVNCHMPNRTFMQVDERRDHSFVIPRPDLSLQLGVPNACTDCHADKDDRWASNAMQEWGMQPSVDDQRSQWATLMRRSADNDVLVTRAAVQSILNTGLPDLLRASLLQSLAPMPSRVSAEVARKSLVDQSAMIRRSAAAAMQSHSAELRWQTLSPYLDDPSKSVRLQIADSLADLMMQLSAEQQQQLLPLIIEYRASLNVSADAVATQLNLAALELRLGNTGAAEAAYQQALTIAPSFVPALLATAEFYRTTERQELTLPLFKTALKVAPDSGAVHHSLGLLYVRQKDYLAAIKHLELATKQADASPYYAYVYAVALDNQNQLEEAIVTLENANLLWPNQYELLMTLVLYYEKAGRQNEILSVLSKLSAIAPAAPAVKQLINKYGQG